MPRKRRVHGKTDIYHVVIRGVNRCIIFEDDDDCKRFLETLQRFLVEMEGTLFAWCLMSNHVHLLLRIPLPDLSTFMKKLEVSYVAYFNRRHDRIGHLFQDRFRSKPVDSLSYLLTVVRYIHQNPQKSGMSATCDYRWSSYREYTNARSVLSDIRIILSLFSSKKTFDRFHRQTSESCDCIDALPHRHYVSDEKASSILRELIRKSAAGPGWLSDAKSKTSILRTLKHMGFPIRQLSRITGLGRKTIRLA